MTQPVGELTLKELTDALVFWRAVKKLAETAIGEYSSTTLAGMREHAAERVTSRASSDDTGARPPLGSVTLVGEGTVRAVVSDPGVFLAWVRARHPDWILETINDTEVKRLKDSMTKLGEPVSPDGEMVPGVSMVPAVPYLRTVVTDAGYDRIMSALAGAVDVPVLPIDRGAITND